MMYSGTRLTNIPVAAISRKVVGKSARDNPEKYCGWFWVHCSSKKFERMAGEAVDICLRVLKESNKSRLDSYSVREKGDWSYPILPFWVVASTFFLTIFLEIAVYDQAHYVGPNVKPFTKFLFWRFRRIQHVGSRKGAPLYCSHCMIAYLDA